MAIHRSNDPKISPYVGPITSNTTVGYGVEIIGCDTTGGGITVTLAAGLVGNTGYTVVFNDEGGAAGTAGNEITIATANGSTIDGGSNATIGSDNATLSIYTNGTNYHTKSSTSGGGTL